MKFFVFLKEALKGIWANKLRSFLTLLGVLIGVFSVTTLVSLGEGVKAELTNQITELGSNILFVVPANLDSGFQSNPAYILSGDILTEDDLKEIRKIDKVAAAVPLQFLALPVFYSGKPINNALVVGVSKEAFDFAYFSIGKGSGFEKMNETVVGTGIVEAMGFEADRVIGKKLRIKDREVVVKGVFKASSEQSLFGQNDASFMVAVPIDLAAEIEGRKKIFRIMVQVGEAGDVEAVKESIQTYLNKSHQEDVSVMDQEDLVGFINSFLSLMTAFVSAIAAISLVVGGVGIMNIMLVSITERTREIGLRKAVGAKPRDILWQFLLESVVLTFSGGLVGVLLSLAILMILSFETPLPFLFSYKGVVIGVVVSILVGLLFGLFPAWRAAQKDPIQALRYE